MYNLTHRFCGGQLSKYDAEEIKPGDQVRTKDFTMNNGENPIPDSKVCIECPKCKKRIIWLGDIEYTKEPV